LDSPKGASCQRIDRPPSSRTHGIKVILLASLSLNALVIDAWVFLLIRYR
jgi:hypothetical protein